MEVIWTDGEWRAVWNGAAVAFQWLERCTCKNCRCGGAWHGTSDVPVRVLKAYAQAMATQIVSRSRRVVPA